MAKWKKIWIPVTANRRAQGVKCGPRGKCLIYMGYIWRWCFRSHIGFIRCIWMFCFFFFLLSFFFFFLFRKSDLKKLPPAGAILVQPNLKVSLWQSTQKLELVIGILTWHLRSTVNVNFLSYPMLKLNINFLLCPMTQWESEKCVIWRI